jgi:hypothetical protein
LFGVGDGPLDAARSIIVACLHPLYVALQWDFMTLEAKPFYDPLRRRF